MTREYSEEEKRCFTERGSRTMSRVLTAALAATGFLLVYGIWDHGAWLGILVIAFLLIGLSACLVYDPRYDRRYDPSDPSYRDDQDSRDPPFG